MSTTVFAEFKWCRSLREFSLQQLASAEKPVYPKEYSTEARDRDDGTWIIDAPLSIVWAAFVTTPMKKVWSSSTIEYGFAMMRGEPLKIDEREGAKWPGLQEGMRFYMDTLGEPTGSLCNMGFGIEVTEIQSRRLIKYDYLEFSPAYGEQWITFEDTGEGQTRIQWKTRYLGKDLVIDILYKIYHYEAINSFMKSAKAHIDDYMFNTGRRARP